MDRDPYDSLARPLAMAETPQERAAVGAALAEYYAHQRDPSQVSTPSRNTYSPSRRTGARSTSRMWSPKRRPPSGTS